MLRRDRPPGPDGPGATSDRGRRVLALVSAFLRAGVLSEDGVNRGTITGTPQGGILSPLLANIALSGLDEHFARRCAALGPAWTRAKRRRTGVPAMRLIRYADDFVVMVAGGRDDAEALRDEVAMVLAPMGLRLSAEKTRVCHIDEGFDFLGWRIQRRSWRGRAGKRAVYTYPSKKALASVMDKVRSLTRREKHRALADLLHRLNPVLGGPRRRERAVPATGGGDRSLPLPGRPDPDTLGERAVRITRSSGVSPWRAGCGESRTSGSEGGSRSRTG